MGINMKENTTEGAAFENAMSFFDKNRMKDATVSCDDNANNLSVSCEDNRIDSIDFNEFQKMTKAYKDCPYNTDMNLMTNTGFTAAIPSAVNNTKASLDCCYGPDDAESSTTRPSKDEYYLGIAEAVSKRGTCLRRKYGAIIVKDDRIVSTGYVGAPRGRINCCDRGTCFRMENNIPRFTRYETCRSVHSEMNAVINASIEEMNGATMYLVGIENDGSYTEADCCSMCKRVIINSGISTVVFRTSDGGYRTTDVCEWIDNDDSLTIND